MIEEIVSYEEREKMKDEGWKLLRESGTLVGKCSGLLRVIDAHYWRQREVFAYDRLERKHTRLVVGRKYGPGYTLDIDDYVPHWLHSMKHKVSDDVMQYLEENWGYSPQKSKYLPDGFTIYQFEDKKKEPIAELLLTYA